ncbi:hypothetical protein CR513_57769, partial [Mucuna pruriens]
MVTREGDYQIKGFPLRSVCVVGQEEGWWGAIMFCKIDLRFRYHQIIVKEGDVDMNMVEQGQSHQRSLKNMETTTVEIPMERGRLKKLQEEVQREISILKGRQDEEEEDIKHKEIEASQGPLTKGRLDKLQEEKSKALDPIAFLAFWTALWTTRFGQYLSLWTTPTFRRTLDQRTQSLVFGLRLFQGSRPESREYLGPKGASWPKRSTPDQNRYQWQKSLQQTRNN